MTISEASQRLNLSQQLLRVCIQQAGENHPFGVAIGKGKKKAYYINDERLKRWVEGSNDDSISNNDNLAVDSHA